MSLMTFSSSHYARTAAAASVLLAAMLLPLSFTGGVVTTPAIADELGGDPAVLGWITNGFMLTFGSFLLAAGTAADALGRKRIFIAGLILFCFSCLVIYGGESTTIIGLLRAVQGVAAAMTLAGGSAALAQIYQGPARIRAFSLLGTLFGAGLAFGPLLIGLITDAFGWRWVYASLGLFSAGVMLVSVVFLPSAEKKRCQKTDSAGIALFTAAVALFTLAVMLIPQHGILFTPVLALFFTSIILIWRFAIRCRKVNYPVFDLSLLHYSGFAGVLLLPIATCYCYVVLLIVIPLHFMGGEGLSETRSALLQMALTCPMLIFPAFAAVLTRWYQPGTVSAAGLFIAAGGLLLLGPALQSGNSSLLIFSLLITGAGAALPWGLMDGLAVSAVPVEKAGMAAGLFNTVRVAGEGIALAMVTAFLVMTNQLNLEKQAAAWPPEMINRAAAWLGNGNLNQAVELMPQVPHALLKQSYDDAYTLLFQLLAGITVLCAVMVGKMLSNGQSRNTD